MSCDKQSRTPPTNDPAFVSDLGKKKKRRGRSFPYQEDLKERKVSSKLPKKERPDDPKEKCGKYLTLNGKWLNRQSFKNYDEDKEYTAFTHCSNPECPEYKEFKRIVYRCHRRDHKDYKIKWAWNHEKNEPYKKIILMPDDEETCTHERYRRARDVIEEFFANDKNLRFAVFTQLPVVLKSEEDLRKNIEKLIKCLRYWTRSTQKRPLRIERCVIVVDPIKRPDGTYHLHYNVAWVGRYIPKSRLEERWAKFGGGYVRPGFRGKRKGKSFTIHYLALRTAVMNEPNNRKRTPISDEEYERVFEGVKFLRFRFLSKKEREYFMENKARLDFMNHICTKCLSEMEIIYLQKGLDYQKILKERFNWTPPPTLADILSEIAPHLMFWVETNRVKSYNPLEFYEKRVWV